MWDAIVAGAGPAGAVVALTLSRQGRRVLLADKLGPSGHKIGEALPGAAVALLRALELPTPASGGPHTPIGGNFFSWNSNSLLATDFIGDPAGPGWRLDRLRFDADLRGAAAAAGAAYRAANVRDLLRQDGHWAISFDDGGTEQARWIVDATGRRVALGRRLRIARARDTRLIAIYAIGRTRCSFQLNRTVVEAVPEGWWYAARLPSGAPVAGFHTDAREAARLAADPGAWHRMLAGTRHIGTMLHDAAFESPMHAVEACAARLARFRGDGWTACGDAALCFDPISGQGIFAALRGGMAAGAAVAAALDGDEARLDAYGAELEQAWTIYRRRCRGIYRSEHRWAAAPFWSMFGEDAA